MAAEILRFVDAAGTQYPGRASVEKYLPMLDPNRALYFRVAGRLFLVTKLAANMDEANAWMKANPSEGLLEELEDGVCVIAKLADKGLPPAAAA